MKLKLIIVATLLIIIWLSLPLILDLVFFLYSIAPVVLLAVIFLLAFALYKLIPIVIKKINEITSEEIIYTIIPDVDKYEYTPKNRVKWTYLHGRLEDDVKYDIFGVAETVPIQDGIYKCQYEGKPCTMFLWNRFSTEPSGLVVYNDDLTAYEYALKKYTEKSIVI
jgi:hypothetical protein